MKRILIPLVAIVLSGLMVAQVVPDDDAVRPRQERAIEVLKSALGLDDNQIQQLRDVRQSTAEANQPIAEQIRTQRENLRALREAGIPDPTQVGSIVNEMARLQDEIKANREQGHEQAVNLMNGWGLGDRLEALQAAAELIPALGPAQRLGLLGPRSGRGNGVRGNGPGGRRAGNGMRPGRMGRGFGPGPGGPPPQN